MYYYYFALFSTLRCLASMGREFLPDAMARNGKSLTLYDMITYTLGIGWDGMGRKHPLRRSLVRLDQWDEMVDSSCIDVDR